jgi:hypothetical protein
LESDPDSRRTFAGEHGLGALAVALVGGRLGPGRAGGVAQVVAQLGAHGALDEGLLERHRSRVDGLPGHRPGDELVNLFVGDALVCARLAHRYPL